MTDSTDPHGLPLWPAPERNKQPILQQLLELIPPAARSLLEVASATGQHALHFASALPHVTYQPSDYDEEHLSTLRRRVELSGLANLLPPLRLNATSSTWPAAIYDVVYNANMVHIAPWEVAEGLFRGAGQVLGPAGVLLTYGPYQLDGRHTSLSNEQFDASLRERDSRWGVRDLADLERLAGDCGLRLSEKVAMPANNYLVRWARPAGSGPAGSKSTNGSAGSASSH